MILKWPAFFCSMFFHTLFLYSNSFCHFTFSSEDICTEICFEPQKCIRKKSSVYQLNDFILAFASPFEGCKMATKLVAWEAKVKT